MKTTLAALAVAWTVFAIGSGQVLAAATGATAPESVTIAEWCNDYKGH